MANAQGGSEFLTACNILRYKTKSIVGSWLNAIGASRSYKTSSMNAIAATTLVT